MDEFCKKIGIFVITAIMFAIPILYTCCFAFGWDMGAIFPLTILTAADFVILLGCVYTTIDENS